MTTNPARMIWLMCSILDLLYCWPLLEVLEVAIDKDDRVVN